MWYKIGPYYAISFGPARCTGYKNSGVTWMAGDNFDSGKRKPVEFTHIKFKAIV